MTFSTRDSVVILALGTVGVLIAGLQPQLLGALAAEGRVTVDTLGTLAAVELLAMGVAAGAAGFVFPAARLRPVALAALVAAALADLASPWLDAPGLFAARIAAGLGEGVLVWVAIGFIVRTARPDRWSGAYLMIQTLAQFAIASLLGGIAADSGTGFTILAAVTAAGVLAVPLLPASYAPPVREPAAGAAPPVLGVVSLLGVLAYLAFVVALWVYVEPLAAARGLPPVLIHLIAPLSLAMQVLGAGLATLVAGRLNARMTLVVVGAVNLVLIAAMAAPPSAAVFVAATAIFGFLWLFALPFQVPLVIAADPTRRAALLIGGAQLAGSSIGPIMVGALVRGGNLAPVPWFAATALVLAVGLLIAASLRMESPPSHSSTDRG